MFAQDWACVRMQNGCMRRSIPTCAYRGSSWFTIPKIDLFAH